MPLTEGEPAPVVSAPNQDGEPIEPDFAEPTVLYFYPRDGTSGCTTEAEQFDLELATYREAGLTVYGVSTDDVDTHREFHDEVGLGFDLLSDPDGTVAAAFDVEVTNDRVARTTFVLANGDVRAVYRDVDPDGHAREVLEDALDHGLVSLPDPE